VNTREPREAEAGSYAPSVLKALAVHLAVVLLLFVSFSSAPVFEPAKPIVQATLVQLNSKSPAQTQTDQRIAGEAARTAAQRHEAEELKRDQQKQKQQEAAAAAAKASEQAAAKLRLKPSARPMRLASWLQQKMQRKRLQKQQRKKRLRKQPSRKQPSRQRTSPRKRPSVKLRPHAQMKPARKRKLKK
jgi:colicin import membrane protein